MPPVGGRPVIAPPAPKASIASLPKNQRMGAAKLTQLAAMPKISGSVAPAPRAPKPSGPSPYTMGAVRGITPSLGAKLLKGGGGIVGRFGNEIAHLPASTLEGVIGLAEAPIKDALGASMNLSHGSGVSQALPHSQTLATLKGAAMNDPIVRSIRTGSLNPMSQDPLGTALDLTGAYGIVGKGAGALARAGALGDSARAAAALGGRTALETAPGVAGAAESRGFSPNVFTQIAQKAMDRRAAGLPKGANAARMEHLIRQQVAASHTAEVGVRTATDARAIKTMRSVVPKGTEEKTVAPLVAATGVNADGLRGLLARMEAEPLPKNPDTLASHTQAIQALRSTLAKDAAGKFDWGAVNKTAAAYKPIADLIEAQKHVHGIQDAQKMAQALDNKRALLEPNVHYLKTPTTDPRLAQAVKDAKAYSGQAQKDLLEAQKSRAAYLGTPAQRGAYRGASSTLSDLTKSIPVHPVTDHLMNKALDLRQILDTQHPEIKAMHDARVSYLAERAQNAAKALQDARQAVGREKLHGTMIEDSNVPQLKSGPLKGMSVRPVTSEDVAAMRQRDPSVQSYVSARNPDRAAPQTVRQALGRKGADQIIRPAGTGHAPYTGESLLAGDYRSGWSAFANSFLKDLHNISSTREENAFMDRYSIPGQNGLVDHPTFADARAEAQKYQDRTGLKVSSLHDPRTDTFRNVPRAAVRELNRQRSIDNPSALGKGLVKWNKAFRHTVLPYSPKLPVMHTVENASRLALLERGNLPRIFSDYRLGKNILANSDQMGRDRLATLATPGSLSRSGAAGEAEDFGHVPVERGAIRATAHAVIKANDAVATQIIHGQRWLERSAQTVALGAHGRRLLQEFGHSWADANNIFRDYSQKLANHLATPADGERAARAMHDAMGKYNSFTANSRLALRVMPFGSWYANAAKLVYVTLPRDHPLFSALVHDTQQSMAPQWNAQHQGLPGDLQTAINVGPNAWEDIGKLTPIGLPNQSPVATAAQLFLPQLSSGALALAGKDPFMGDLKGRGGAASPRGVESGGAGTRQSILSAIEQLLEPVAGPTNDISRLLFSHGGTFYNTDTPVIHALTGGTLGRVDVKPGSTHQQKGFPNLPGALDRVLDPFHPTTFNGGSSASMSLAGAGSGSLAGAGSGDLSGATAGSLK